MPWSLTHAKLQSLLHEQILLPENSRILMAVSGGQDSLCLARLLIDLQPHWGWSLAIVHGDHGWRPDSGDNAAYVAQLAESWEIPCWIERATQEIATEEAARQWRYRVFATLARQQGYAYLTTGHTASDRAETLLHQLFRGSGLDGLSSLPWQRPLDEGSPDLTLVRPLLAMTRSETEGFCHQQELRVWQDSSNQDLRYRRNRIRLELLPYLREQFNPKVDITLAQAAEILAADRALLNEQADELYRQVVSEHRLPSESGHWQVERDRLRAAPLALRRRVVRALLSHSLRRSPNFRQVEQFLKLLDAPNGSRTSTYPSGLVGQVRKPYIWLGHLP